MEISNVAILGQNMGFSSFSWLFSSSIPFHDTWESDKMRCWLESIYFMQNQIKSPDRLCKTDWWPLLFPGIKCFDHPPRTGKTGKTDSTCLFLQLTQCCGLISLHQFPSGIRGVVSCCLNFDLVKFHVFPVKTTSFLVKSTFFHGSNPFKSSFLLKRKQGKSPLFGSLVNVYITMENPLF